MTGHRRLLADQRGFTMVSIMLAMMVVGLFAVGAWQAAVGDIPIARGDQDRKRAYEAAQAGLEWYAYQLERDPTYWTQCASVPNVAPGVPAPVNLEWNGSGSDPRRWRTLPQSNEQYTVEILRKRDPVTNAPTTQCSTSDPAGTALQGNTLRIRATGKANGHVRSLIGTFKRKSFIDFIYFTQWETLDPVASGASYASCNQPRSLRPGSCTAIQFANADQIKGPLHTNDESILVCGSPTFGRTGKGDAIEINGASPGYLQNGSGCSGTPTFNGPKLLPGGDLSMPPSNGNLQALATGWTFSGNTCLKFNGTTVDVYQNQQWVNGASAPGGTSKLVTCTGTPTTLTLPPANGVIYVANTGSCSGTYQYYTKYSNSVGCGDVAVSGTYGASVTIGAQNDIIVNGNLTRTDETSMLGLIANNFVRVYHPVQYTGSTTCGSNVTPQYGTVNSIDAAILSLTHSFIVDNWHCGASLGNLTIRGAIAQYFRGPVGTSGGTGYIKDYNYDDRLKTREPPNFLDPVTTSWRIVRQTEQQPATG